MKKNKKKKTATGQRKDVRNGFTGKTGNRHSQVVTGNASYGIERRITYGKDIFNNNYHMRKWMVRNVVFTQDTHLLYKRERPQPIKRGIEGLRRDCFSKTF